MGTIAKTRNSRKSARDAGSVRVGVEETWVRAGVCGGDAGLGGGYFIIHCTVNM